jgi:Fe-S cluster assembly scaffold protein SufB
MDPQQLAADISAFNNEPDELLSFRQQAANDLPSSLAPALSDLLQPLDDSRRNVSDTVWNRVQKTLTKHGIQLTTLKQAIQQDSSIIEQTADPTTPIQHLCHAFFTNGIYINVPADTVVDQTLQPLFKEFAQPRIDLIVCQIGENAEARFIEGCFSPRNGAMRAGTTQLHVDNDAELRYGNLQNWRNTPLLHTTTSHGSGDIQASQFIQSPKGIIETEPRSQSIINDHHITGNKTNAHINGTIRLSGDYRTGNPDIETLKALPEEYRAEIKHILQLRD